MITMLFTYCPSLTDIGSNKANRVWLRGDGWNFGLRIERVLKAFLGSGTTLV